MTSLWGDVAKFIREFGRSLNPRSRRPDGQLIAPQIERALSWIGVAFLLGLLLLAALAQGQASGAGHFFAIAALAALGALGVGGALGILFGLPSSSNRVTVVQAAPVSPPVASSTATTIPQKPQTSPADDDWYRDNTSLEQIAMWLTTAIVALSLANFDGWLLRFDHLARTLTCAMYTSPPAVGLEATTTPSKPSSGHVGIAAAVSGAPHGQAAIGTKDSSPVCPPSDGVPGGLILAANAIFGFLAGYLWARRYLMAELAGARNDQRLEITQQVISERRAADRAEAGGLIQSQRRSAMTAELAAQAAASFAFDASQTFHHIPPGSVTEDPWKGQFGGKSANDPRRDFSCRQRHDNHAQFLSGRRQDKGAECCRKSITGEQFGADLPPSDLSRSCAHPSFRSDG